MERALDSAARYLKEGGAQAVKVEGGQAVLPAVRMMTQARIPVMGHLCLAPQNVHVLDGTRRVQGRGGAGTGCWRMALALQDAGAFAEVLEAIPADLGTRVSEAPSIPTAGIGAGG